MPRSRTLTGRSERRRDRLSQNIRRNNVGNYLIDVYKIALNVVPSQFESFNIGQMNLECQFCKAKHFESEITMRNRTKFTSCCHKGKVFLQPLSQNDFFNSLYQGLRSSDRGIKKRSKQFFEHIRSYNSSFAMISSEAKIANTILHGVYHFKIHDVFMHRAGPMTTYEYGRSPTYAQLYFYDTDTALNYRLRASANNACDRDLMREISLELDRVNPFIRSFRTMKEHCDIAGNESKEICLVIKVNKNLDIRRYNDAVQTDVAVIFNNSDGEPPFERNMIAFSKVQGTIRNVSVLDSSLDPLAYPCLFPNGDTGWHTEIVHNIASTSRSNVSRKKVTMLQYTCFRLALRDHFSFLHHAQKLFLQWVVDMYVRIEGTRLHYIRSNQLALRSELYNNLTDFLELNPNGATNIGRKVILPSSFSGSPRNMYQNYLDAMSIVQHFGKPSLFITMTCNPNWPEIVQNIDFNEAANFRPEIIVRVFNAKLKELIHSIVSKRIFGIVKAIIYTIEFQKRGLPHAHILITLDEDDRIAGSIEIDKIVCAEIPDVRTQPKLHEYVVKHMIHGPCGLLNPNSVCMSDGKCTKDFPKEFCESTRESVNGYPIYRRRDNNSSVDVRGKSVDNRYVVPYNPYLLAKFNCHINVEVCTSVRSVKYIYKYVYKGYDSATVEISANENVENARVEIDEIQNFLNGRYVGSTESLWRIYEIPMHFQSHTIYRLDIHLPNRQNVYFREGQVREAVDRSRNTKLLAFFHLNRNDPSANAFKYTEIPLHYVWIDKDKYWKKRIRGGDKIISRMYSISPKDVELFHLRLLLLHVTGPISFQDVRTYDGIVYNTFVEACFARGIASNDNEWRECLNEAKEFSSPKQLRNLFGFICALNVPANALLLWNEFKVFMSEDFARNHSENVAFNRALLEIEEILNSHNVTCESLGLPTPTVLLDGRGADVFDPIEELFLFNELHDIANVEQQNVIDIVLREVQHRNTGSNVFCLTAHAGCGKTFTQTAIIHKLQSLNLRVIATAFSGIASTLLIGGRTLHNVFKLPIPILDTSVSKVTPNSSQGHFINASSLILIDEVSMAPLQICKVIDRLLKDLCTNDDDKRKPFAGKTVLLCGDFRQILPVVPHGSRATLIENCVISWDLFPSFHHLTLTQNMRALPEEVEFIEFLKKIGNGEAPKFPHLGEDIIEIPSQLVGNENNIIDDVYGNIVENILTDRILKSVVLAPTNECCAMVNRDVLNRLPGESKIYHSYDKVICDDALEINNYPVEFLNSLNVSGLPPHKLELKVNSIVILIRNLNTSQALVNGTRMRVKVLHHNTIDCEVLTGVARNKRILIPRINLTYSGTILPFDFQRTQFPIILAFAMTINKSQGQTFDRVGILLRRPVFTHGQLYVAASRVRSFDGLTFYISEHPGQGHLANDERVFTKNIVFTEVLTR